MSEQVLVASSGRSEGSPASRRMRTSGQVPGILYGSNVEPISISFDGHDLRSAMSKRQLVGSVVTLELDGKSSQVIIKEIQRHPVRQEAVHVDCQVVAKR